jgi:hypothetical protein
MITNYKKNDNLFIQTGYGGARYIMSKNPNWQIAGTIFVCLLLVINISISAKLLMNMQQLPASLRQYDVLPCKSLPAQFVIQEPECSEKLLRLMNITNVHILPAENFDTVANDSIFGLQNKSVENIPLSEGE